MIALLTPRNVVVAFLLLLLAAVPLYAAWTGNAFLVTLFTRIVILGMAATTLNLILGYGGMGPLSWRRSGCIQEPKWVSSAVA